MGKMFDWVEQATNTTGTGDVTLGLAIESKRTYSDAGAEDGDLVNYVLYDKDNNAREVGEGTLADGMTRLVRTNIISSTNSGAAIDLSGSAVVFCDAFAGDFNRVLLMDPIVITSSVTEIDITGISLAQNASIELKFSGLDAVNAAPMNQFEITVSNDGGANFFSSGYSSVYQYKGISNTDSLGGSSASTFRFAFRGESAGTTILGLFGSVILTPNGLYTDGSLINRHENFQPYGRNWSGSLNPAGIGLDAVRIFNRAENLTTGRIDVWGHRK